jgi:non-canonical poly(A) RNA polymerase PAPD5/7
MYSFTPAEGKLGKIGKMQLSLKCNETVNVVSESQGWYHGCSAENTSVMGIFPANYIKLFADESGPGASRSSVEEETPLIAAAGSTVRDLLRSIQKAGPQKGAECPDFLELSPLGQMKSVKKDEAGSVENRLSDAEQDTLTLATSPSATSSKKRGRNSGSTASVAAKRRKSTLPMNPNLRLHCEILDFAKLIEPTERETLGRQEVVEEVKSVCQQLWPRAYGESVKVDIFGSFLTGLCLPKSDVDIVIFGAIAKSGSKTAPLFSLAKELKRRGVVQYLEVIDKARVPIVKFTHKNGTHADVCFDQPSGPNMGRLIRSMLDNVPGLRPMILVLKYFLLQRELNETYKGGVGSFMLQIMCIASIQYHARELWHKRYMEEESVTSQYSAGENLSSSGERKRAKWLIKKMRKQWENELPLDLGSMLLQFLEFFGTKLNYPLVGLSVRGQGKLFNKKEKQGWYRPDRPNMLSIENPESPDDDLAKNSYRFQHVRSAFAHSFYLLAAKMRAMSHADTFHNSSNDQSLLSLLIDVDAVMDRDKKNGNTPSSVKLYDSSDDE